MLLYYKYFLLVELQTIHIFIFIVKLHKFLSLFIDLLDASRQGDFRLVRHYLATGVDVNGKDSLGKRLEISCSNYDFL